MAVPDSAAQEALLDALSDLGLGMLVVRGDRSVYANEAAAKVTGVTVEELLKAGSLFEFIHPDDRKVALERFRQRAAGGRSDHDEFDFRRWDGRHVVLEMSIKLMPPDGRLILYRDVTERRTEENRLRQAEKMAAMGLLVAGVAHDINNPLAVALSQTGLVAERLQMSLARREDEHVRKALELVHANRRNLERIGSSIRRLEGLAAPQMGRRVKADLRPQLDAAIASVRASAPAGVSLDVDLDAVPALTCDAEVVGRAVENLLLNAVEAVGTRGRIALRARSEADAFRILVEDDGPGFAPEALERAFEPFFTTKPAGNAGLGLGLARSVAQDHGGTLVAENRPEGGARLVLTIPLESTP